ncbi:MAG: extracellular solute-binding protein [Calditrichia bacterium]
MPKASNRRDSDYAFSGMPVPDDHSGAAYTYGDPKNLVIFNTCPNPRKAWEFVKFLTNRENDLRLLELTNQLPRRKNLFEDDSSRRILRLIPK